MRWPDFVVETDTATRKIASCGPRNHTFRWWWKSIGTDFIVRWNNYFPICILSAITDEFYIQHKIPRKSYSEMAKTRLRRCAMNGWTFHLSSRAWPTQVSLATIISTRDLACLKGWMRTCRTDQSETVLSWLQPNISCWRVELWPRIFMTRTNGGAGQRNWKRYRRKRAAISA